MRIALIGPGIMSIPPPGWGAVESLIWDYQLELTELGHQVDIINTPNRNEILKKVNKVEYDFVHIHYDVFHDLLNCLRCPNIGISSHYPYVDQIDMHARDGYSNIFAHLCDNKNFNLFCISNKDKKAFLEHGANPERTFLLENGANPKHFNYSEICIKTNKSVYLGKIESRKRQFLFQDIPDIDFIGVYQDSSFNTKSKNYLGEITPREKLFDLLTEYANLVLLSTGENGSPLVVKEALCAGLGVVVSEFAASELDTSKDFITVILEKDITNIDLIQKKIKENRDISIHKRKEIRKYFDDNFSWKNLIVKYIDNINHINSVNKQTLNERSGKKI